MRIVHATDIHWMVPPHPAELLNKRLLGTANLYLKGRRHEFHPVVQDALVHQILAMAPDAVMITGDLTAQGLPAEFSAARVALDPVLARFPTIVTNGNHDVYVDDAFRRGGVRGAFGPWCHGDPVGRLDVGDVTLLTVDPNRAHWSASGHLPDHALAALQASLDAPDLDGRDVILGLHYPIVGPSGRPYTDLWHGLRNADAVIAALATARNPPALVVHGHKHHGYAATIVAGDRRIPSYNPGSSGLVRHEGRRQTAAFNALERTASGWVATRWLWTGAAFEREEPGSYASGWTLAPTGAQG